MYRAHSADWHIPGTRGFQEPAPLRPDEQQRGKGEKQVILFDVQRGLLVAHRASIIPQANSLRPRRAACRAPGQVD